MLFQEFSMLRAVTTLTTLLVFRRGPIFFRRRTSWGVFGWVWCSKNPSRGCWSLREKKFPSKMWKMESSIWPKIPVQPAFSKRSPKSLCGLLYYVLLKFVGNLWGFETWLSKWFVDLHGFSSDHWRDQIPPTKVQRFSVIPLTFKSHGSTFFVIWRSDNGSSLDVGPRSQRGPPENGKSLYKPYNTWVFMGYNPQESLENTINTMGTRTLGVHPIVPWSSILTGQSSLFGFWIWFGPSFPMYV